MSTCVIWHKVKIYLHSCDNLGWFECCSYGDGVDQGQQKNCGSYNRGTH